MEVGSGGPTSRYWACWPSTGTSASVFPVAASLTTIRLSASYQATEAGWLRPVPIEANDRMVTCEKGEPS